MMEEKSISLPNIATAWSEKDLYGEAFEREAREAALRQSELHRMQSSSMYPEDTRATETLDDLNEPNTAPAASSRKGLTSFSIRMEDSDDDEPHTHTPSTHHHSDSEKDTVLRVVPSPRVNPTTTQAPSTVPAGGYTANNNMNNTNTNMNTNTNTNPNTSTNTNTGMNMNTTANSNRSAKIARPPVQQPPMMHQSMQSMPPLYQQMLNPMGPGMALLPPMFNPMMMGPNGHPMLPHNGHHMLNMNAAINMMQHRQNHHNDKHHGYRGRYDGQYHKNGYDRLQDKQQKLIQAIQHFISDPETNTSGGPVPSERVQNCIRANYKELYDCVVGGRYGNQWHRFLQQPSVAEHIVLCQADRNRWYIRLPQDMMWEDSLRERADEKSIKEGRMRMELINYLQTAKNGICTPDEFLKYFKQRVDTDPAVAEALGGDVEKNFPRRGQFVRFIKKNESIFQYDNERFLITMRPEEA